MGGLGIAGVAKSLGLVRSGRRGQLSVRAAIALLGAPLPLGRTAPPRPRLGEACAADDCAATTVCRRGTCRCAAGWDACGTDRCHFLPMSHAHCGACGAGCGPDQLCSNGRCV